MLIDHHTRSTGEVFVHSYKRERQGPLIGTTTAGAVSGGAAFNMPADCLLYVAVSGLMVDGEIMKAVGWRPTSRCSGRSPTAGGADPVLNAAIAELPKPAAGRRSARPQGHQSIAARPRRPRPPPSIQPFSAHQEALDCATHQRPAHPARSRETLMTKKPTASQIKKLRSRKWFDNPDNPDMTALYLERYMNYGLTREELSRGKPIIGIAQSGSDLSPCNRHHLVLAERVREGIREAGGIAFEFPVHPIQETGKRPTASLDRNLAYLGLVEILYGYPLDGVVLTTGCDKTTPSQLMAAATVDIPAIVLSGGPMLNGWFRGERTGSGTIVWKARQMYAAGEISYEQFVDLVASSAPSLGHCNTMGTASTMNSLAEALGMSLPGCAAPPAPHKERAQHRLRHRQAHRRHGVGGPAPLQDHDARSVRERDRRQFGDRRLDQRAHPFQRHRQAHRRRARQRRLGEDRLRRAAAGRPAAGRRATSARSITAPAACPPSSTS